MNPQSLPGVSHLIRDLPSGEVLQSGEGGGHGHGVHALGLAEVPAEITRWGASLLLGVDLGVERGVQGSERSLHLPVSPGESLLGTVARDVTQTLAAHSRLAFKAAERRILKRNIEVVVQLQLNSYCMGRYW